MKTNELFKSKTFYTGVAGAIGAAVAAQAGAMSWSEAFQIIVPSLLGIFIRAGMIKHDPRNAEVKNGK